MCHSEMQSRAKGKEDETVWQIPTQNAPRVNTKNDTKRNPNLISGQKYKAGYAKSFLYHVTISRSHFGFYMLASSIKHH